MSSENDVTGDKIRSKPSNRKYKEGWDRIFSKPKKEKKDEGNS